MGNRLKILYFFNIWYILRKGRIRNENAVRITTKFEANRFSTTLDDAYRFAQDNGFADLSIVKDLAGKDRVLIGRRRG